MTQITIKSHKFDNKHSVELVFDQGEYATYGKVESFLVFFLEYNEGPYFDGGKEDHHFMVCSSVHFPLDKFNEALEYFKLTVAFYTNSFDKNIDNKDRKLNEVLINKQRKAIADYYFKDIKAHNEALFIEKNEVTLPGTEIRFTGITSTGHSMNQWGVGKMDLSVKRSGNWPWLDLLNIYFSSPTQEQLLDAETSPTYSEGGKQRSNIHRRLSFKQANYISEIIKEALQGKLKGTIPADDEIDFVRKQEKLTEKEYNRNYDQSDFS